MSLFNDILANLRHKIDAQNAFRDDVAHVIKDIVGVTIAPEQVVSLKEGVLTLGVSGTIKMAILLKKDAIFTKLSEHNIVVTVMK